MLAFDDGRCRVHIGHILKELAALPADSVHCVVTSPPYLGLRDYKGLPDFTWGGDPTCAHEWGAATTKARRQTAPSDAALHAEGYPDPFRKSSRYLNHEADSSEASGAFCACGAWRGQLGLEPSVALYVDHMVEVFEAVRRVLRPDGTLWLNLGDSYAGSWGAQGRTGEMADRSVVSARQIEAHPKRAHQTGTIRDPGLKQKDLIGAPWRVAFALQAAGWWLRSDIVWAKPNPMPESVTDRPTRAHEYLFLLAKRERYYYDAEAIREANSDGPFWKTHPQGQRSISRTDRLEGHIDKTAPNGWLKNLEPGGGRNRRSVWTIATAPYPEAHFATFPPDLVRPCIQAGTSERGVCGACGAPWKRVVEKSGGTTGKSWHDHSNDQEDGNSRIDHGSLATAGEIPYKVATTGWQPTCACAAPTQPPLVLDPFLGSGTTLEVAASLGRRGVGIEGNPTYLPLIEKRLRQGVLL